MYYVIKKQPDSPSQCFVGFQVPKYIASKKTGNVIFEFQKDGKAVRKWIKVEDIVLLTDDKKFFVKTMSKFKETEAQQQELVDKAKEKLVKSMETFTEKVNSELNKFEEIKKNDNVPCILKGLK